MPADLPPLLRWTPPETQIIPFPARLRTGKIARVAETLAGSTKKGSAYYWRQTVEAMRRQMEKAGLEASVIDAEVEAFVAAVQTELARRSRITARFWPDGGDAA